MSPKVSSESAVSESDAISLISYILDCSTPFFVGSDETPNR